MMSLREIAGLLVAASLSLYAIQPASVAADEGVARAQLQWGRVDGIQILGAVKTPGAHSAPGEGIAYAEAVRSAGGFDEAAYPFAAIVLRRLPETAHTSDACLRAEQRQALAVLSADFAPEIVEAAHDAMGSGQWARVPLHTQAVTGAIDEGPQLRLFPGDIVLVPRHRDAVHVEGNVRRPGELQYQPGKLARHYLSVAGGRASFRWSHDDWMVLPNGAVRPLALSAWNYRAVAVPPGSLLLFDADRGQAGCVPGQ